jgi:alanine racemase
MDQFLADVSEAGHVAGGDEAVLIGRQGDQEISAREIADTLGTIPWEVLSGLQARLPRVFQDGGNVVGVY